MERRFGEDFSRIRVHTDDRAAQSARAVGARAYTVGSDIVFGAGRYAPRTVTGRGALAHELTHAVQQRMSRPSLDRLALGPPSSAPTEREADSVRAAVVSGADAPEIRQHVLPVLARDEGSPAGGCGVCYGNPANAGTAVHTVASAAFRAHGFEAPYGQTRDLSRPRLDPSPSDDNMVLDHAYPTGPESIAIGEIKPANALGRANGEADLVWYETQLRGFGFRVTRLNHPPPFEAIPFPTLAQPPCPQHQDLYINAPENGLYTYWCRPDYRELVGRCRCEKRDESDTAAGAAQLALHLAQDVARRRAQRAVERKVAEKTVETAAAVWGGRTVAALAHVAARANLLLSATELTLALFSAMANYAYGSMYKGTRGYDLTVALQYIGTQAGKLGDAGGYAMELEDAVELTAAAPEAETEVLRNETFTAMYAYRKALYDAVSTLRGYSNRYSALERRIDWSRDAELSAALRVADGLISANDRSAGSLALLGQELQPIVEWYAGAIERLYDEREGIFRDDSRAWLAGKP